MAVLPIRLFPDPVLREPTKPVDVFDRDLRRFVDNLRETMEEAPGVGLAAPQVGVQSRVLVYDYGEGFNVLVNPVIELHEGAVIEEEGCLSIPGVYIDVERAKRVVVAGQDERGRELRYEAEDMHARVIQHEVDHLDGILFIDRLTPELRKEAMRQIREKGLLG